MQRTLAVEGSTLTTASMINLTVNHVESPRSPLKSEENSENINELFEYHSNYEEGGGIEMLRNENVDVQDDLVATQDITSSIPLFNAESIQNAVPPHSEQEEDVFSSLLSGSYEVNQGGSSNIHNANASALDFPLSPRVPIAGRRASSSNQNNLRGIVQNATINNPLQDEGFSDEAQTSAAAATSKDLAEIYKQFGGLGSKLGRQLFNMYSKEAAEREKERVSNFYIRRASSTGREMKKAPENPDEDHKRKMRERYTEAMSKKNKYQTPKLKNPNAFVPMSRQAAMLALLPRRKPQSKINEELDAEFGPAVIAAQRAVSAGAVSIVETRQQKIHRLQAQMEAAGSTNNGENLGQNRDTMRKGSLRDRGKPMPMPTIKSEEEKLFDAVLIEIQEREDFLNQMRGMRAAEVAYMGSGAAPKLRRQEMEEESRIEREIKERMEELRQLGDLIDGSNSSIQGQNGRRMQRGGRR